MNYEWQDEVKVLERSRMIGAVKVIEMANGNRFISYPCDYKTLVTLNVTAACDAAADLMVARLNATLPSYLASLTDEVMP